MIRFIDLSESYDPQSEPVPRCAFLDTVEDRFLRTAEDTYVFRSLREVEDVGMQFVHLMPEGFFDKKTKPTIMYGIGNIIKKGFSHGPFPSLKMALEIDGDEGDCIFILDDESETPMLGWDGREWMPVFSR